MPLCQSAIAAWFVGECAAFVAEAFFDCTPRQAAVARTLTSAAVGGSVAAGTVDPVGGALVGVMAVDNVVSIVRDSQQGLFPHYTSDKLPDMGLLSH